MLAKPKAIRNTNIGDIERRFNNCIAEIKTIQKIKITKLIFMVSLII